MMNKAMLNRFTQCISMLAICVLGAHISMVKAEGTVDANTYFADTQQQIEDASTADHSLQKIDQQLDQIKAHLESHQAKNSASPVVVVDRDLPAMRRFDVYQCRTSGVEGAWCGHIAPAYSVSAGNSHTTSLTLSTAMIKRSNKMQYGFVSTVNYVESGGDVVDGSYWVGLEVKYHMDASNQLYNESVYEKTPKRGYRLILSNVTGIERDYELNDRMRMSFAVGLGVRQSQAVSGTEYTDFLKQGRAQFNWRITDWATFDQTGSADVGEHLTKINASSKLSTKLTDRLNVQYLLDLARYSSVPTGSRKLNMTFRAGLRYSI